MRRGVKKAVALGREFLFAAALMLLVFTGTVLEIPPFTTIVEWGGHIQKRFWPGSTFEPIDSHPERLTFEEFFEKAGISRELALQRLKDKGIVVRNTQITLDEFKKETGLSPADVYALIVLQ